MRRTLVNQFHARLLQHVSLCFLAGAFVLTASGCQRTKILEGKLAEAEKHQAAVDRELAALDQTLRTRRDAVPISRLWVTPDLNVHRTAIPEENAKGLSWVVLHNGAEVLQR